MNKNTFEGKWTEIKCEVQKIWGTLTNDELEKSKGNAKVLVGAIQQKFGKSQSNVEEKVNEILKNLNVSYEKSDLAAALKKPK